MDGYLGILKLPGITSHDVVKQVRTLLPGHKIGHGGTLDPGAAGVLPILVGKGTKFSSFIMESSKVYRAEFTLGLTTDTGDSFGEIIDQQTVSPDRLERLKEILGDFTGELEQLPPLTSAIKYKGKKLYEYARRGEDVERKPRKVHVFSVKIIDTFSWNRVLLEVHCSKGTYIRSLCMDMGQALGCGGHMSFLLRKEAGGIPLEEAVTLEEAKEAHEKNQLEKLLHPLDLPFKYEDALVLTKDFLKRLCHGEKLHERDLPLSFPFRTLKQEKTMFPVYSEQGELYLLASCKKEAQGVQLKPEKVIKKP